jgi:uncharacterized membrane protein YebE (DUF533 family)
VNDLDIEGLVGSVLRGVLGGRRKRSRGALRYLTGGGRSSFLNASTLLAVAGVAWGLWETAQQSGAAASPAPAATAPPAGGLTVPPPLPSAAGSRVVPPPLPGAAPLAAPASTVPPQVVQVLRLTLAAARADGVLEVREREAILARARELGAEPAVAAELDAPRPIADIVAGVTEPQQKKDLYTLAFAIVRADEHVTDTERAWLTGLSAQLGLDGATVTGLEQQAADRITAAAEGAKH